MQFEMSFQWLFDSCSLESGAVLLSDPALMETQTPQREQPQEVVVVVVAARSQAICRCV